MKKNPIYPLHLGGVWMVGVRGYIGLKISLSVRVRKPVPFKVKGLG
jgi:hypothetical protein